VSILATQTDLQLLLTKGPLGSLPATIHNGRLAIGLDSTNSRAKLFIDDSGSRYEFKPLWTEIIGRPDINNYTTVATHNSAVTELNNSIATKVDIQDGTAINLGIASSATAGAPKVQLLYNAATESLDFTFT
jgi:hypothetical protein